MDFEGKLNKKILEVKKHGKRFHDVDYAKGAEDGLKYAIKQSEKFYGNKKWR